MLTTAIYTRPARPNDRDKLDRFLSSVQHVHSHLDWQPPQAWLGQQPFHLAFLDQMMLGALAAPPDPPGTSWIRLAAVGDTSAPESVLDPLWAAAHESLGELEVSQVACMLLEEWLKPHLLRWGFEPLVDVVVLRRERVTPSGPLGAFPKGDLAKGVLSETVGSRLPSGKVTLLPELNRLRLRPAASSDLDLMTAVDHAAFAPPWEYSRSVLLQAMAQSSLVTVAEIDGQIVGYQISSGGREGAHLARLAVKPDVHGRGIGRALTLHMIEHFEKRGAPRISVNTQRNNTASLNLYHALGFEATGEYYVVWQHKLGA